MWLEQLLRRKFAILGDFRHFVFKDRKEKMLVLSRKKDEKIIVKIPGVSDLVEITVVGIEQNRIKLGFEADPSVTILRKELIKNQGDSENLIR